jgi:hypothetical protein
MGLSRLDNFLKSTKGELIYVDPSSLDATDSIENTGNSLARPFKTLQRALIESARFSYQSGDNNDRFGKTTILLYPGEHIIDNRPGWIPIQNEVPNTFRLRSGTTSDAFGQFDIRTNFDLNNPNNALYKLNSVHGGVIVPRGTSIVGYDLRKTKIIPKYIPDPENDQIERSAIFRVTGACYFWQFSIFDSDLNSFSYKDYTTNRFVPNFSHHKLTCFEYADGVNQVVINDDFLNYSTTRTDLDMYYQKVGFAFGTSSGRDISPDFPSSGVDIQPKVDEYRIVGSTGAEVGITSIKSGDGINPTSTITATLTEPLDGLDVNTPINITGVTEEGYDGQFVVNEVLSPTEITYLTSNPPEDPLPTIAGVRLNISVDTVSSASPYIFNISLRSVFGMNGLLADGNKATGFKSMVLAQFTGIGLQKDPNAFVKYNEGTGLYEDKTAPGNESLPTDSRAVHKPEYANFHVKCTNNSLLQVVSVFAIGFAYHFVAENGGDQSITNSNSNFGSKSLTSFGFRRDAFPRDDVGYISHIVTPKELEDNQNTVEFLSIDVGLTTSVSAGAGTSTRLYLYKETSEDLLPETVLDGYRFGAKNEDRLNVLISENNQSEKFSSKIVMDTEIGEYIAAEKAFRVARDNNINIISSSVITFEQNHNFINGEKIRIISADGNLPDGIEQDRVYFAIVDSIAPNPSLAANQIKVAGTFNDATSDISINFNNGGGTLTVVSRVSDKFAGDTGHPLQFDETIGNWYVNVDPSDNEIYDQILRHGVQILGEASTRTFIERRTDDRAAEDTIFKLRYVIPRDSDITSRPPVEGFILQESNTVAGYSDEEVEKYSSFSSEELLNPTEFRNLKFIADATWDDETDTATIRTEHAHKLSVGSYVEISNVISTLNPTGNSILGYNGDYEVIEVLDRKQFKISIPSNPGEFLLDTSNRNQALPKIKRKNYHDTYVVYKSKEVQKYEKNEQDGIYHLIVYNSSNSPSKSPFTEFKFSQPIENLYPQFDRDNVNFDPPASHCSALATPIGRVVIDNPESSITKETLFKKVNDFNVGFALTDISSDVEINPVNHVFYTNVDHGLNRIIEVEIADAGLNYGSGIGITEFLYNARLVSVGDSVTGDYATAHIKTSPTGSLDQVLIVDGGSAYGIGNSLAVVGVTTTSNHVIGVVNVTRIYDNTNDAIVVTNVNPIDFQYDGIYKIAGVEVGKTNEIVVNSAVPIGIGSTAGVGLDHVDKSIAILDGKTQIVTNFEYDNLSGIATVTLLENHGFQVNDKIFIAGFTGDSEIYNGFHIIRENPVANLDKLIINVGISTITPGINGSPILYPVGYTSRFGNLTVEGESSSSRIKSQYANLTSRLIFEASKSTDEISIANLDNLDLKLGDYIEIDDEILRIKRTVVGNPVKVFRGLLGTKSVPHRNGSVVRRIKPIPTELRRHSILRASGHTFEYLGFGPGNYSTAFPDRQDRQISAAEEVLSQSFTSDGGFIVYNGLNSDGDFYISNKRKISTNGEEEVFATPYPRFRGETESVESTRLGNNVINSSEINVEKSIRVDGGDNKTDVSKFDGPVIFNNKLTTTSPKGVETPNIFLQGNEIVSRKYTVGITQPQNSVQLIETDSGNPGDVIFNGNPVSGQNAGWIYTSDNEWYPFAPISTKTDRIELSGFFIGTFFGDGAGLFNVSDIWAVDAVGIHTTALVGFATNSAKEGVAMYCAGNAEIMGTMKVFEIIENTTIINDVGRVGSGTTIDLDLDSSSIYYFTQDAIGDWTVNFRANVGLALTDFLNVGDSLTVAVTTKQGSTAYYNDIVKIDNTQVLPRYYGSLTINSGNPDSLDLYTYVIIRKDVTGIPSLDFEVLYSQSQYR